MANASHIPSDWHPNVSVASAYVEEITGAAKEVLSGVLCGDMMKRSCESVPSEVGPEKAAGCGNAPLIAVKVSLTVGNTTSLYHTTKCGDMEIRGIRYFHSVDPSPVMVQLSRDAFLLYAKSPKFPSVLTSAICESPLHEDSLPEHFVQIKTQQFCYLYLICINLYEVVICSAGR